MAMPDEFLQVPVPFKKFASLVEQVEDAGHTVKDLLLEVALRAQPLLIFAQQGFDTLHVFNFRARAEPFDDLAFLAAQRGGASFEPAVISIRPANAVFHVEGLAPGYRTVPGGARRLAVVVVELI